MSVTPQLKISYYAPPHNAGRSLPARVALAYKGIPVEFDALRTWRDAATNEDRKRFPIGDIPVLEVKNADGSSHVISETTPVNHYAGTISGLWPTDALRSTQVLEAFHTFDLILTGTPWDKDDCNYDSHYYMTPEVAAKAKAGPITRRMKFYLTRINDIVANWPKNEINIFDISITSSVLAALDGTNFRGVDFSYLPELKNIIARTEIVQADQKLMTAMAQIVESSK